MVEGFDTINTHNPLWSISIQLFVSLVDVFKHIVSISNFLMIMINAD